MPSFPTHEQIIAFDDSQRPHHVLLTFSAIVGHPELRGLPHFTWNNGRSLNLIDKPAGILECAHTKRRLTIKDLELLNL